MYPLGVTAWQIARNSSRAGKSARDEHLELAEIRATFSPWASSGSALLPEGCVDHHVPAGIFFFTKFLRACPPQPHSPLLRALRPRGGFDLPRGGATSSRSQGRTRGLALIAAALLAFSGCFDLEGFLLEEGFRPSRCRVAPRACALCRRSTRL